MTVFDASTAYFAAYEGSGSALTVGVGSAQNPNGPQVTLLSSPTTDYNADNVPFFHMGSNYYAFDDNIADAGNNNQASTVLEIPDNLGDGGKRAIVNSPEGFSAIMGARPAVSDRTKVDVIGAGIALDDAGNPTIQVMGAQLPPDQLMQLSLTPPQFPEAYALSFGDVAFDGTGKAWMDDEFLSVGTPGDQSGGVVLLWLGPDGHPVSSRANSGKIIDTANAVKVSAVYGNQHFNESGGTLFIAWIESILPDGSVGIHEQLWAAKVSCSPYTPPKPDN
jgi:hypothetical protein